MARRSQHSFLKRQKELKRKDKAAEKLARRQGKIDRPSDAEGDDAAEQRAPEEQAAAGEEAVPEEQADKE